MVVPLDPNYSAAQVTTILRDSGARLLIVSDALKAHGVDSGVALANLHQEPVRTPPLEPVEPLAPLEVLPPVSLRHPQSFFTPAARRPIQRVSC